MPNGNTESGSKVDILSVGNVLSNIAHICNICKESPISFNPFGACACKQLCRDVSLQW